MAELFTTEEKLGVGYIIGGGDVQNGHSVQQLQRIYAFGARHLQWLEDPPYRNGQYRQSSRWIEVMGNKEAYGFLKIR